MRFSSILSYTSLLSKFIYGQTTVYTPYLYIGQTLSDSFNNIIFTNISFLNYTRKSTRIAFLCRVSRLYSEIAYKVKQPHKKLTFDISIVWTLRVCVYQQLNVRTEVSMYHTALTFSLILSIMHWNSIRFERILFHYPLTERSEL